MEHVTTDQLVEILTGEIAEFEDQAGEARAAADDVGAAEIMREVAEWRAKLNRVAPSLTRLPPVKSLLRRATALASDLGLWLKNREMLKQREANPPEANPPETQPPMPQENSTEPDLTPQTPSEATLSNPATLPAETASPIPEAPAPTGSVSATDDPARKQTPNAPQRAPGTRKLRAV